MKQRKPAENSPCHACGGTGQLNLFRGESRFLLTAEECPHCAGFGYILKEEPGEERKKKKKGKK